MTERARRYLTLYEEAGRALDAPDREARWLALAGRLGPLWDRLDGPERQAVMEYARGLYEARLGRRGRVA